MTRRRFPLHAGSAEVARIEDVTPSMRTLPARVAPTIEGRVANIVCTCPPSRSTIAGPAPLYGS
mgnify:CR=1 FL=1